MFFFLFSISLVDPSYNDQVISLVLPSILQQIIGPRFLNDPINSIIDPITAFLNPDSDIYDIAFVINLITNITQTRENGIRIIDQLDKKSSYDFFLGAGSNQDTLDNIRKVASYIQQDAKVIDILGQLLDSEVLEQVNTMLPTISTLINAGSFDIILDRLFDAINVDRMKGKEVLIKIVNRLNRITIGKITELCGFKIEKINHFFVELEKTFTPETGTTFIKFFENIGFQPSEVLNKLSKYVIDYGKGKKLVLHELFNQIKIDIFPIIDSLVGMLQDVLSGAISEIIPPVSHILDFSTNTFENRIDSLIVLCNELIAFEFLLPDIGSIARSFQTSLEDIKTNGFEVNLTSLNTTIDLVELSLKLSKIDIKDSSIVKELINALTEDDSTLKYIPTLISTLSNEEASLGELVNSICALIGGQDTIETFRSFIDPIINQTLSLIPDGANETSLYVTISNIVSQMFVEEQEVVIGLYEALIDLIVSLITQLMPGMAGMFQGTTPNCIIMIFESFSDLFLPSNNLFSFVDNFIGTEFNSKVIPNIHLILSNLLTFLNETNIEIPQALTTILSDYSAVTGAAPVSLIDVLTPLTSHSPTFVYYLGQIFEGLLRDNCSDYYNRTPKSFIDLNLTIMNIISWSNNDKLCLKDIINTIVVTTNEEPIKRDITPEKISFNDIVPLPDMIDYIKTLAEQSRTGNLTLDKFFRDILNYNATALFDIASDLEHIVSNKEYSASSIVKLITNYDLTQILADGIKIFAEAGNEKIELSSVNELGSLLAREFPYSFVEYPDITEQLPTQEAPTSRMVQRSVAAPDNNEHGNGDGGGGGLKTGAIVGIVIGCVVALAIVIAVIVVVRKRKGNDSYSHQSPVDYKGKRDADTL